jgi:hypothetical protein
VYKKLAVLNNIAVVKLVIVDTRIRLPQLGIADLLYRPIATHRVIVIAEINIIVKVRFAPVVSAGIKSLHNVPRMRITVRMSPVIIPVFTAFLITRCLMVKKDILY